MGLCKCPKKKVTTQFCFEHRVNVCEHCLVSNHPKCIVKSYLNWLQDSDYNPVCTLCNGSLAEGDVVRLICFDVFHWGCLNSYAASLPTNTAPAGYTCPNCKSAIFPPENQISPVADQLRKVLATATWARVGLGLPVVPDTTTSSTSVSEHRISRPDTDIAVVQRAAQANHTQTTSTHPATEVNQSPTYTTPLSSKTELRSARDYHVVDVRQQNTVAAPTQWADADKPSTVSRKIFNIRQPVDSIPYDHDENKYQRRGAIDWFTRWFWSRRPKKPGPEDPNASLKRTTIILILLILAFTTVVVLITRVGRGMADQDPFLDPMANPNIKVQGGIIKNV
ncbi:zinc finger protein-like 1 homolog isoform X3 [Acropora millepora]|uniref:zinc finger protein-like 1 homolog isoform X3 n=1 Tax=Acropora millepora TaxID=45264 RepID=UPI001CF137E2|nr:zinc finger protein-like 1 homolog isoform X3 [Acropora millepora]